METAKRYVMMLGGAGVTKRLAPGFGDMMVTKFLSGDETLGDMFDHMAYGMGGRPIAGYDMVVVSAGDDNVIHMELLTAKVGTLNPSMSAMAHMVNGRSSISRLLKTMGQGTVIALDGRVLHLEYKGRMDIDSHLMDDDG